MIRKPAFLVEFRPAVVAVCAVLCAILAAGPDALAAKRKSGGDAKADLVADASISYAIRAALLESLQGNALAIYIVTEAGCVELTGAVPDQESRQAAERIARRVKGVKRVDNLIDLADEIEIPADAANAPSRSPAAVPDALLEARVKTTLLRQLGMRSFRLAVAAERGVVSLAGAIPGTKEREQAVASVMGVPGVRSVLDEMRVERSLRRELAD